MNDFQQLKEYISQELNFATGHYNDSHLRRRITSRIRRTDKDSYGEYLHKLRHSPEERTELLNALSINVTEFFRDSDVWEDIRSLLRELSETKGEVNIWSAGCADGREPYSIAMLGNYDPLVDTDALSVLGTDISQRALDKARKGVYEEPIKRDIEGNVDSTIISDYVEENDSGFQVSSEIKEMTQFERHDLINDGPKPKFDIVLCRNLFIYINNGHTGEAIKTLRHSLADEGYLVLGKTETIPHSERDYFNVANRSNRIYKRKLTHTHG